MNPPIALVQRKPPNLKAQAGEFTRQLLSLFPAGTLVLAVLASLAAVAPSLNRLFLDLRSDGEPWRPFTAHLAHGSWMHFASNILVFVPVSMLRERQVGSLRHVSELSLLAVFVAAGVRALDYGWTSYCGLSGVTYGLLTALLLDSWRAAPDVRRKAPFALIVLALAVKSALELSAGGWLLSPSALKDTLGVAYLPGSHCAGILGGLYLGRPDIALWRKKWSTRTSAAMASTRGTARGSTHGSCLPVASSTVGNPPAVTVSCAT
jgi:rhomboid family GlyGly-CTERM serine protease